MNTKLLYRLAWKEIRTLQALWLTLFGAALVLQVLLSWIVGKFWAPYQVLFMVPIWIPVMFSLACASVAFAGEREEKTDQLLSRLAVPPLALWSVKLAFNVLGTILLFAVLFPMAWAMGSWSLGHWLAEFEVWDAHGPLVSMSLLALLWEVSFLSWGLFLSLLFRRVLTCLVLATVATVLTPIIVSVTLELLPFQQAKSAALNWTVRLAIIPGCLLLASSWLVQTWDEDRWPRFVERLLDAWRRMTARSDLPAGPVRAAGQRTGGWRTLVRPFGFCWPDESLPAWRRETRRLLWLEWRQAWQVMAFVMAAFGVYVICQGLFVTWGSKLVAKEFPFVVALLSFIFGAWSFQAQQSGQRFRDFAGHGASPMVMWFIKQAVWFGMTLLMVVIATAVTAWLSGERDFFAWRHDAETLWRTLGDGLNLAEMTNWSRDQELLRESLGSLLVNVVLAAGLYFAVGQLLSLLIPRAVTVATVGFVLASLAFGWQQLTAWAAIPSGLAVFPLIVGLLLASAARMSDWLEERNSIRGWLKVVLAFGVPSLVTLIGVPIYRIVEIPVVSDRTSPSLNWVERQPLTPAAKQVGEWWIRMAESLEDEPIFLRKVRAKQAASVEPINKERETIPNHLFVLHQDWVAWDKLKNRDWLTRNAGIRREIMKMAPLLDDCAFDPEIFEGLNEHANYRFKRLGQLAVLLKIGAEAAIAEGKLDEGLQHYLILLRLSEHIQQHAQWNAVQIGERLEIDALSFLLRWTRHPAQTGDSLRAALRRSANRESRTLLEVLETHTHRLPPPSNVIAEEYAVVKQDIAQHWREARWPVSWMFWERKREERLLDFSAAVGLEDMRRLLEDWIDDRQGDRQLIGHGSTSRNRKLAAFLQDSTRHPNVYRHLPFVWGDSFDFQRANERLEAAAWRRGLIATLALRAFQLDHGRLPTEWYELIGPYLDSVPVDPWNGESFELRPHGYPFDIEILGSRIPAQTPLFVSCGPHNQRLIPVVRPPVDDKTSPTVEWFASSSYELRGDRNGVLTLIAFPLTAAE